MGIKLQISKRKGIAVLNSAMYSETCLNQTLNKTESCINQTINKVPLHQISVNLTCINQTPVYFECKSWSHVGSL